MMSFNEIVQLVCNANNGGAGREVRYIICFHWV